MYDGAMFLSQPFKANSYNPNNVYQFVIVAGRLVADPKVEMFNKKKTSFTVKFHTKSFCNIEIWGEDICATIAATLEKDDMVLAIGTQTTKKYTVRNGEHAGEEREWTSVQPQILLPMSYLLELMKMIGSKEISSLVEKSISEETSDPMESINDFKPPEGEDAGFLQLDEDDVSIDDLFR